MILSFTTASPIPKAEPPPPHRDIIVSGDRVGEIRASDLGPNGTLYHATFNFPGLGACGTNECIYGHGDTEEHAVLDAFNKWGHRLEAITAAVRELAAKMGAGK